MFPNKGTETIYAKRSKRAATSTHTTQSSVLREALARPLCTRNQNEIGNARRARGEPLPKTSASRHPRLTQRSLMFAAHVKNINDDANGTLRVTLESPKPLPSPDSSCDLCCLAIW
jgi:hypothetical protein